MANRVLLPWSEYRRALIRVAPGLGLYVVISVALFAKGRSFPGGRWGEAITFLVCIGLVPALIEAVRAYRRAGGEERPPDED